MQRENDNEKLVVRRVMVVGTAGVVKGNHVGPVGPVLPSMLILRRLIRFFSAGFLSFKKRRKMVSHPFGHNRHTNPTVAVDVPSPKRDLPYFGILPGGVHLFGNHYRTTQN